MNKLRVHQILDLVTDLVNNPSTPTWRETRDLILEECSEDQKTALYEFAAWFDDSETE